MRSIPRIALFTTAAIPALLACVFHALAAKPQSAAVAAREALHFDRYAVHRGLVEPDAQVAARFEFINRGDQAVEITKLSPSCGCLRPRLEQRRYEPGEAGELVLRVQTANEEPGPHEYFLDVHYQDPEPRVARLTFKVVLPERSVIVRPPSLFIYQLGSSSTEREVTITDFRERKLRITGIQVSGPEPASERIAVKPLDVIDTPSGERQFTYELRLNGRVPPGEHRLLVRFATDDAAFPELRVPVWIQGRAAIGEEVSPASR